MRQKVSLLLLLVGVTCANVFAQNCVTNTTKSSPITHYNLYNDTIQGLDISNASGDAIALYYCKNIVIKDCILGPSFSDGVFLYDCENITIINCEFTNNSGGDI